MQTNFTAKQLADPQINAANDILRNCVHCGFCTATCPTYVTLGDELDSPRGRIYLIKDMLEEDRAADDVTVKHIDRCLSCLSCMTTCPSGVHYMHLVDHARTHIHETYKRPLPERALRFILALVLPRPKLFRLSLLGAKLAKPFKALLPGRLKGLVDMAPGQIPAPSPVDRPQVHKAIGKRRLRVALLNGCAQKVLDPAINEATIRLLTRHGVEVVIARGAGCCGALTHHMGMSKAAHVSAARNINAWHDIINGYDLEFSANSTDDDEDGSNTDNVRGLDHIVINTSGCGTTVKDYGFMFRNDPKLAGKAARISAMTRDITELMYELGLAPGAILKSGLPKLKIAYHSACSMQHGQKITSQPVELLESCGFEVYPVPESHLCCGSAGTYNLLQPDMAQSLRDRKVANIETTGAQVIAAGNLGCIIQIRSGTDLPIVHSVELLDWATGGPCPSALEAYLANGAAASGQRKLDQDQTGASEHRPQDFIVPPAA